MFKHLHPLHPTQPTQTEFGKDSDRVQIMDEMLNLVTDKTTPVQNMFINWAVTIQFCHSVFMAKCCVRDVYLVGCHDFQGYNLLINFLDVSKINVTFRL